MRLRRCIHIITRMNFLRPWFMWCEDALKMAKWRYYRVKFMITVFSYSHSQMQWRKISIACQRSIKDIYVSKFMWTLWSALRLLTRLCNLIVNNQQIRVETFPRIWNSFGFCVWQQHSNKKEKIVKISPKIVKDKDLTVRNHRGTGALIQPLTLFYMPSVNGTQADMAHARVNREMKKFQQSHRVACGDLKWLRINPLDYF